MNANEVQHFKQLKDNNEAMMIEIVTLLKNDGEII
jgi:hypothetical protein